MFITSTTLSFGAIAPRAALSCAFLSVIFIVVYCFNVYKINRNIIVPVNYNQLDNIVEKYFTIKKNNDIINTEKLKDITFCITGKVNIWKNRDELSQTIMLLGGKVVGSVSKNVNYLINNDITSNSSKNLKAKDLGIKIISEQDFQKMFDIQK